MIQLRDSVHKPTTNTPKQCSHPLINVSQNTSMSLLFGSLCISQLLWLSFSCLHAKWCSFSTITWYVFIKSSSIELCVHWKKSWDNFEKKTVFFKMGQLLPILTKQYSFWETIQIFTNYTDFFSKIFLDFYQCVCILP